MAERNRHIAIVGAGPAGIFAALAARERGARVSLLDTNETVGRKLLVTGNGRCNITNVHASAERYVCADRAFVATALGLFGHPQTVARLRDLAILTYATPDGWCYPLSESAATVVAAFEAALRLAGVEIHLKTKVSDLAPVGGKWQLTIGGGPHKMEADRVIVSSGGKAYPALGSKGELFPVLERLGHHIEPVYPALVPLTAQMRTFHKLQGVRLDAGLRLYEGVRILGEAVGNLLFTSTGLSGPAAMD
ncbi:MAG: aminoacetone oxidase family FAD-binding enzyme, partial [Chloroflexi bacterium]|nr:aminoacetone oxidase family FAD-binding enzyme [Chloroflexota bacterium]